MADENVNQDNQNGFVNGQDSADRIAELGKDGEETGVQPIRAADAADTNAPGAPIMTEKATEVSNVGGYQTSVADAERDEADTIKEGGLDQEVGENGVNSIPKA